MAEADKENVALGETPLVQVGATCGAAAAPPPCTAPPALPTPSDELRVVLEEWLKTYHPSDVLMPIATGRKCPMFGHKGNKWSWAKYDEFAAGGCVDREGNPCDWSIVLSTLCVIDADSVEVAAELEERFPVLRRAPCEQTRRGFHYFFKRSARADELGCWDGCAQVLAQIDFKTKTATGTGGIIVVSPSSHKTWIRAPWLTPLEAIPDDLLDAVAAPRKDGGGDAAAAAGEEEAEAASGASESAAQEDPTPSSAASKEDKVVAEEEAAVDPDTLETVVLADKVTAAEKPAVDPETLAVVLLKFTDSADAGESDDLNELDSEDEDGGGGGSSSDGLRVTGSQLRLLRSMDFCSALLSGRWGAESQTVLRVPCRRAVMVELLHYIEHGTISQMTPPTVEMLAALDEASAFLGARRTVPVPTPREEEESSKSGGEAAVAQKEDSDGTASE